MTAKVEVATELPGAPLRGVVFADPASVPLQKALDALADPVRRQIVRELAEAPDWSMACGSFQAPVTKATKTHHFSVLRDSGLLEQRELGTRRLNRLRRDEFEAAFPGLLELVLAADD